MVGDASESPSPQLSAISTDSRSLAPGSLFVPLVGERFDGHRFLADAVVAGCRALLLQTDGLEPAALESLSQQAAAPTSAVLGCCCHSQHTCACDS